MPVSKGYIPFTRWKIAEHCSATYFNFRDSQIFHLIEIPASLCFPIGPFLNTCILNLDYFIRYLTDDVRLNTLFWNFICTEILAVFPTENYAETEQISFYQIFVKDGKGNSIKMGYTEYFICSLSNWYWVYLADGDLETIFNKSLDQYTCTAQCKITIGIFFIIAGVKVMVVPWESVLAYCS
jgi:hypothetical protein